MKTTLTLFVLAAALTAAALSAVGCAGPSPEADRLEAQRAVDAQSKFETGPSGAAPINKDAVSTPTADN